MSTTLRLTFIGITVRRIFNIAAAVAVFCAVLGGRPVQAAPQMIQGTTGEGALYEFAVPENWNGVLAVYAHGIVSPGLPIGLPAGGFIPFRNALLEQGVAVAYSSYSENGFAVKDGEQRTHQLLGLFKSQVGIPSRVYIMGHSLGGTITMGLAEKYPSQYDGALPMCGFLGGTVPELTYVADVRILFDALFPGVVPGSVFDVPADIAANPGPTLAAVQMALIAGFATGKTQQLVAAAKLPGSNPFEFVQSAVTAIGFNLIYTNDLLERTHGRIPIDNTLTDYGALNDTVDRFASSPDAVNYIERYETPTGRLLIPMVTMHTSRDPVVPLELHEPVYASVVADAGASEFLRQRTVSRYGHCTFTVPEMLAAFGELRAWVEQGVTPSP